MGGLQGHQKPPNALRLLAPCFLDQRQKTAAEPKSRALQGGKERLEQKELALFP